MNNYEAPVVVSMGPAHELILGVKPEGICDSDGAHWRHERVEDIDEGDE